MFKQCSMLFLIFVFTTCFSVLESKELDQEETVASKHWLYDVIPASRSQIKWYDVGRWLTWAILGNDDDGIFGEKPTAKYHTKRPISTVRAIAWAARNPLHNFNFYVIGSAYRENSEFTILKLAKENSSFLEYKTRAATVFAGKGTSFYLGFHGWKPFVSLRLDYGRLFDFYFGWRERGNFGIKLVPAKKKKIDGKEKV